MLYSDHAQMINELIMAALRSVDPARALDSNWSPELGRPGPLYVVGAGKASLEMALKLQDICEDNLVGGAVAVVPERLEVVSRVPTPFSIYPAAHPIPDDRNVEAAQAIAAVASQAGEGDTLIVLISGGGSAHLTLPAGDVTLDDLRQITGALLKAGAPIQDLNAVRKHCEQIKGGGLAGLAHPAQVQAFILSDVIGDSLDVIASGPTAPDPTSYSDALNVLRYYDLYDAVPGITAHLEAGARGDHPETLKADDPIFERVTNTIIGSNRQMIEAVDRRLRELGWHVAGCGLGIEGEARVVGIRLARLAYDLRMHPARPVCYLMGSETTVTVRGSGRGGRNQEMALAAAIGIDMMKEVVIFTFASDGVDGTTNAAGAVVTGETCVRARDYGLNPQTYLDDNDSYTFFDEVGGLLRPGPTGTNVNDLAVVLVY